MIMIWFYNLKSGYLKYEIIITIEDESYKLILDYF
jgi:hypothetical protein